MPDVLIPYAGEDLYRARHLAWVRDRYRDLGYRVILGDGDPYAWRKAVAVEDALRQSTSDVVVIADADVWCDDLPDAIDKVMSGEAGWATPYWGVQRLTLEASERFKQGERDGLATEETHHGYAGGGIVVLWRAAYEQAPLDPRFVGWGGEDQAWAVTLRTMVGKSWRSRAGVCWHLWHPPQTRLTRAVGSAENEALRAEYAAALNTPGRMRAVIAEGRAWATSNCSSKT